MLQFNHQILNRKMDNRISLLLILLLPIICVGTGVSPVWVASSYFKAGGVTFTYTLGSVNQNSTITYSTAIINTTLKVPTLGITDLNYQIVSGKIYLLIQVVKYTSISLTFNVKVNANLYLTSLKLTYMALDNLFTPAFSMNYYFPSVAKTGPNINAQFFVNFTSSTGVTLNTSHQNVLLPFMHYIDCTTTDSTIDINLEFNLLNGSYYSVIIRSSSNMNLNYAGFSRLIFDKTAIEAMGNDYFNYGMVLPINSNFLTFSTTIPPNILPQNLFYGIHSFSITTGPTQLNFISSYNTTSGFIGYFLQGTEVYMQIRYSYMHHKTRTCPASYPYFNISEMLCYDRCSIRWYGHISTMTCSACLYDCLTCTSATTCTSCDSTSDHRQLSANRCAAMPGYYDDGTSSPEAKPCSSACATCVTSATYCLSCISGFYLQGTSCLSCSAAMSSCSTCTNATFCTLCIGGGNGTTCTTCTSNEYLASNSTCVACSSAITNCQTCTSNSNCTLCQNTFTIVSATNCNCISGQYLSSGQCVSCSSAINYCSACSSATSCSSCASTFTLLSSTNCGCNTTTYLDTTASQCKSCTLITQYCQSCNRTTCNSCVSNFTLTNGACTCQSGYYANSTNNNCASCSSIANCLICTDNSNCTSCGSGYKVNSTTGACDVQPCNVANCDTCIANSTTVCKGCNLGYSVSKGGTSCQNYCGNYALESSQQCDDGNAISGDGCSSLCKKQSQFSCYVQYINETNTYSWCFYTGNITFSKIWIRKFQGNNSLKFQFELTQFIKQWQTVNFTSILGIDQYDSTTRSSMGITQSIISSYYAQYQSLKNRFFVIVNYIGSSMQKRNLIFSLNPYAHNTYPAFSPPNNIEFNAPNIDLYLTVTANNNQNANLYSENEYNLYRVSIWVTYFVVGLAMFGVLTSLVFRTAKVIAFEMITIMQITYFSVAFLDSMNPVYSGMLPMRYLAGILTFQDVQIYLEELTSPNSMKGIYMFLNLSQNLNWVALGLVCFLGFGFFLMLIYWVYDCLANSETAKDHVAPVEQRKGFWMHQLAFHFIGELSLSLIFLCLPIYTVSLFFEILFTLGQLNFWSYAQAFGLGLAILGYFIALLKSYPPKQGTTSRLGEYISEFNCLGCFKTFKYGNFQILEAIIISGLVMATIYSNSKVFSALCIVLTAVIDIVVVAVVKPYRFGFVSCFKGDDNDTEILFEKIELYKVYDKQQPTTLRIKQPEITQKSQQNQNNSQLFTQHFAARKNVIKSKHQGLVQAGQTLNHTKLFLFNNNSRRIANLTTLIVVQFVFIFSQIYSAEINKSYQGVSIQNMLPLIINMMMTINVVYNYAMIVLQILDRKKHDLQKVEVLPQSASLHLKESIYTNSTKKQNESQARIHSQINNTITKGFERLKNKLKSTILDQFQQQSKLNGSIPTNINLKDQYQNSNLIIKKNSRPISQYFQSKPQIIRPQNKAIRKHRRNYANEIDGE